MLSRAIVRPPSDTFASGLTSGDLGAPDVAKAREQHATYCAALERCGLTLIHLPPADDFPDSTFVEDTAIVLRDFAVLTRPGAASRAGEVALIEPTLRAWYERVHAIAAPGTVDGGDVCQAGKFFFIGVSERTNEDGARQLAAILEQEGLRSAFVDVREIPGVLHLRSAMSYLGDNRLTLIDTLADRDAFRNYDIVLVPPRERYAANCLRVNDHVLVAASHPRFEASLRELGYNTIALDMSEFRKMDGALTCLSLRF